MIAVSGQAEEMLQSVDDLLIEAMMDSVVRHRTADEFDGNEQRVSRVRDQLLMRWRGVVVWFVAGVDGTSQADELRGLARGGIREVAAAAGRIQRTSGGVTDRSADYQRLEVKFRHTLDQLKHLAEHQTGAVCCRSSVRILTSVDDGPRYSRPWRTGTRVRLRVDASMDHAIASVTEPSGRIVGNVTATHGYLFGLNEWCPVGITVRRVAPLNHCNRLVTASRA